MKKTVLVGGCSHSTDYYTRKNESWPSLLQKKYECDLIRHTISGIANLLIIDKLMWELNNNKIDLVIFQITEQYRTVLGINHTRLLEQEHSDFHGATCKPINIFFNADFWERYSTSKYQLEADRHNFDERKDIFLDEYPSIKHDVVYNPLYYEMFDTFYLEQILPSTYETQVRYLRELYLLQNECKVKNVPILFIEWWKPLLKMNVDAVKFYYNKLDRNKFVEFDYDKNWMDDDEHFGTDGCHFNVKGHKMFFEKYVEPNLPIKLDDKIQKNSK